MEQTNRWWAWVLGAAVLIVALLGLWWWSATGGQPNDAGYNATTTDALTSANVPPTVTVAPQAKTGSVTSVLTGIPDASHFASLLSQSGVASQITDKGPYTLFVPINEAAAYKTPDTQNLTAAQLKRLVQYHIVAGKSIDVNAQTAGTVTALSKDMLNFSVRQGDRSARINSSVALQEFKASNGVIYLIDQVLLPPTQ